MRIPDPLAGLAGGPLHRLDIAIAEAVTGVPRRSISRHLVQPAVLVGIPVAAAVALLHWVLLALVAGLLIKAWSSAMRTARRT